MEKKIKNRALVLSGGSIKGAFQAGAVAEILGSGFTPDAIYGVSVGGLNGAFLADRAGRAAIRNEPPDWAKIGEDLATFWKEKITSFDEIGDTKSGLGPKGAQGGGCFCFSRATFACLTIFR